MAFCATERQMTPSAICAPIYNCIQAFSLGSEPMRVMMLLPHVFQQSIVIDDRNILGTSMKIRLDLFMRTCLSIIYKPVRTILSD